MPSGIYNDTHSMTAYISTRPESLRAAKGQNAHFQNGSLQAHTSKNTTNVPEVKQLGHRHENIDEPPAYAISQGTRYLQC
jgi:hypothetical protein